VILFLSLGRLAQATSDPGSATKELLKLIPPDSGVVLTIDDLRGHVRNLMTSKLAIQFLQLPAAKAWFDSEKYEQLEAARDQIEGMLQAKLTEIRDQVLGDAVVFALRLPTDGSKPVDPGQARGLLVLKAKDPALLKRVIELFNSIQKNNGELAAVVDRSRGETPYFIRQFPEGSNRHADTYTTFADGTFAISNSEELIQQLIDRKMGKTGSTADRPASPGIQEKFEAVGRRLPDRALARLVVDARFVKTLLENPTRTRSPAEALLKQYARAHESAGAALVVREGQLELQIAEIFESGKFHERLDSWSQATQPRAEHLDRVPRTALLVGSVQIDFAWLYRLAREWTPEAERPRLANGETVLSGLLLGQDLSTRVLPALGPRVLAIVEGPFEVGSKVDDDRSARGQWPWPTVLVVELASQPERKPAAGSGAPPPVPVADALDNALNTLLALITFDPRLGQGRARIVTQNVAGASVKSLEPRVPLAYAVDRPGHRLVLGSSPAAVKRYLEAGSDASAGDRFRQLQARGFHDSRSFVCLDLRAVQDMLEKHRDRLTDTVANQQKRPRQDVAHDLNHVLALSQLLDAVYLTNRIDTDSSTAFHTLGFLARPAD
jgi:hypothetical protein